MKHMQYTFETSETLEIYTCNMCSSATSPYYLREWRLVGVPDAAPRGVVAPQRGGWERATTHHAILQQRLGGVELAAPAEKVAADPVKKAVADRSGG
jgi:hypothetical protein